MRCLKIQGDFGNFEDKRKKNRQSVVVIHHNMLVDNKHRWELCL